MFNFHCFFNLKWCTVWLSGTSVFTQLKLFLNLFCWCCLSNTPGINMVIDQSANCCFVSFPFCVVYVTVSLDLPPLCFSVSIIYVKQCCSVWFINQHSCCADFSLSIRCNQWLMWKCLLYLCMYVAHDKTLATFGAAGSHFGWILFFWPFCCHFVKERVWWSCSVQVCLLI